MTSEKDLRESCQSALNACQEANERATDVRLALEEKAHTYIQALVERGLREGLWEVSFATNDFDSLVVRLFPKDAVAEFVTTEVKCWGATFNFFTWLEKGEFKIGQEVRAPGDASGDYVGFISKRHLALTKPVSAHRDREETMPGVAIRVRTWGGRDVSKDKMVVYAWEDEVTPV